MLHTYFVLLSALGLLNPHHLHAMFPTAPSVCPHCLATDADFYHMVWPCLPLLPYWTTVLKVVRGAMDKNVPVSPTLCLLVLHELLVARKVTDRFLDLALVLAHRHLTMSWKSPHGPDAYHWGLELVRLADCEREAIRLFCWPAGMWTVGARWFDCNCF